MGAILRKGGGPGAQEAGLLALPFHLDRLKGHAAMAAGDLDLATTLLSKARDGFETLGAP